MYVEISLFNTQFDKENIFVGESKDVRESVFDNFDVSKTLRLPKSAFNLNDPFRIEKGYFELDRKYNYAEYKFFDVNYPTVVTQRRYYFINSFDFVQDNITRLNVTEDIIGSIYEYISFSDMYPDLCTSKKNEVEKIYTPVEFSDLYKFESSYARESNLLYTNDDYSDYIMGGVIVNYTADDAAYSEYSVNYNIGTIILNFFYNTQNGRIINSLDELSISNNGGNYYRLLGGVEEFGYGLSVGGLRDLYKVTEKGFNIISTSITFDFKGIFEVKRVLSPGQYHYTIQQANQSLNGIQLAQLVFNEKKYIAIKSLIEDDYVLYSSKSSQTEKILGQLYRMPYAKISFFNGGDEKIIDPTIMPTDASISYNNFTLKMRRSFLPPYGGTVIYSNNANFTEKTFFTYEYGNNFMSFSDSYKEFIQSNYNATVMGLKVNQGARKSGLITDTVINSLNTAIDAKNSGQNAAMSLATGNLSGAVSSINSAKTSVLKFGIEAVGSFVKNGISEKRENDLLNLRLKDVENVPDSASFSSTIETNINNKRYVRLFEAVNSRVQKAINYHKKYGFKSGVVYNGTFRNLRMHQYFDFFRSENYTININTSFSVDTTLEQVIYSYLSSGVRLWYDINNFKNFNVDNIEV